MDPQPEVRKDLEVLEQHLAREGFQRNAERIRELAESILRRTRNPETLEAAKRILNAATYLELHPERRDTYEPVLVRSIAMLRASVGP